MIRKALAVLLLASNSFGQVVSVKTTIPSLSAPGFAPSVSPALSVPVLAAPSLTPSALTPSLVPAALAPVLAAPVAAVPVAPIASAPTPIAALKSAVAGFGKNLAQAPQALVRLFDASASVGDASDPVSAAAEPIRPLASIKSLKVGTYNVLNLFQNVGKHVPDEANPGKLKKISEAQPKDEASLRAQGKVILENDLDIVTMEEVENIQALEDFNRDYLGGKYKTFLIEGNDERGIDVAFLVKKDLPLQIEHRSHKDETWIDPVFGGGPTTLFSRDLTSLVVRAEPGGKPLFVLFGTHFKSKRDRDGRDPESRIMRGAQVQRAAEIIGRYREEFGPNVPVMLAGDFNGVVPSEPEFKPLFEAAGLMDAFDATPNPPSDKDRITHTFHPKGGATHQGQMDAVLVSKGLRGAVKNAEVYRYKNEDGSVRPIPTTYEERSKNPSDHFPVVVTLDFAPIREHAIPDWKPGVKPEPKPDEGLALHATNSTLDLSGPVKEKTMALVAAYLSAAKPDRQAAYLLSTVYYEGFESVERVIPVSAETRRQVEAMLAVLDSIVPRAEAVRHREAMINQVVNSFSGLLYSFDHRDDPPAPPLVVRTVEQDARDFSDSAKAWLKTTGPAFDAKIAQWNAWIANPGQVNNYTARNLPKIQARIDALKTAKEKFARAAAGSDWKALYNAWDELRATASDSLIIVADSFDADLSKRGLMANIDQNSGRHPGGFETFLSAGLSADWDGARRLNEALRKP